MDGSELVILPQGVKPHCGGNVLFSSQINDYEYTIKRSQKCGMGFRFPNCFSAGAIIFPRTKFDVYVGVVFLVLRPFKSII